MNKSLEKKIEKYELLKSKKIEEREAINSVINDYDKIIKELLDLKKQQEKLYQTQKEIDEKIKGM